MPHVRRAIGSRRNLKLFKHPVKQQPTISPRLNVCAKRPAPNAFLLGCLICQSVNPDAVVDIRSDRCVRSRVKETLTVSFIHSPALGALFLHLKLLTYPRRRLASYIYNTRRPRARISR